MSVSWIQKAINFTFAAAKHAAGGFYLVSDEDYEKRLNICNTCDRLSPEDQTCLECGCNVALKARWASEACPLSFWLSHSKPKIENQRQQESPSEARSEPSKGQKGCGCG